MKRLFKQDDNLYDELDRAIAKEQEIAADLDAFVAAYGRYPTEREKSDICEMAALKHSKGGCIAMVVGAVMVLGAFAWIIGGIA